MPDNDDYDAMMADCFGVTEKIVLSPEDEFFFNQTNGAAPKIDNMLYWLKHEMEHYYFLLEEGIRLYRQSFEASAAGRQVGPIAYGRLMVKYYLQMHHLTRFTFGEEKLDFDKTVALFVEHQPVKKVIEAIKPSCTNKQITI